MRLFFALRSKGVKGGLFGNLCFDLRDLLLVIALVLGSDPLESSNDVGALIASIEA
jgi:hypothetical protein